MTNRSLCKMLLATLASSLLASRIAVAEYTPATQPGDAAPGTQMDYGPFLASSVSQDPGPMKKGKKAPQRVGFAERD